MQKLYSIFYWTKSCNRNDPNSKYTYGYYLKPKRLSLWVISSFYVHIAGLKLYYLLLTLRKLPHTFWV